MLESREGQHHLLPALRNGISETEQLVKAEFERTTNTWIDCVGTRVANIRLLFALIEIDKLLSEQALSILKEEIDKLHAKWTEMKEEHKRRTLEQKKRDPFIKEEKQEILQMFKDLGDKIPK